MSVFRTENTPPTTVHDNPLRFESFYDKPDLYFEGITNIYPGIPYEHDSARATLLLMYGPSGAGKDTVMEHAIAQGLPFTHVTTATTRHRRFRLNTDVIGPAGDAITNCLNSISDPDKFASVYEKYVNDGSIISTERPDSYIWMRGRKPNESQEDYIKALINEYGLVERDFHHGNLYGLPQRSIEAALSEGLGIPVIRNETQGAITINKLFRDKYNVLNVAVLPDSMTQIDEAARVRENPEERLRQNLDIIRDMPEVTNFYLRNSRLEYEEGSDPISGIDVSVRSIRQLLAAVGILDLTSI